MLTGELLLPYDVGPARDELLRMLLLYDVGPTGEELLSASVTGQMVVEIGMVFVTTVVESAGQLVIDAAQDVTVTSVVEYTVLVV